MHADVLIFDDLRELSRAGPRATLSTMERWARREGIRYGYDARGGIWTTVDALNVAIGVSISGETRMLSPDDIL